MTGVSERSTSRDASGPGAPGALGGPERRVRRLRRDFAYVLPGMPLAVGSFAVLLTLTVASIATAVVWVGALLMPLTLLLAGQFAEISRRRLRSWGVQVQTPDYRPSGSGLVNFLRPLADPRRWFDLAFETVIALPLRIGTFTVAIAWSAVALDGVTRWLWSLLVPFDASSWSQLLSMMAPELVPSTERGAYLLDSGISLVIGAAFLLTLPTVIHGLARFDAFLTGTLLSPTRRTGHARSSTRSQVRSWGWMGCAFIALILLAVNWPLLAVLYGINVAMAMVLAFVHSGSAVLAMRWAQAGVGLSILAAVGTIVATSPAATQAPWPWAIPALLTHCLVLSVLALRHRWYWSVGAWTATALLTAGAWVLLFENLPRGSITNGVVQVALSAVLVTLGILGRQWRQRERRTREAEELSVREVQRRRDLEERNRIARELHDVVAHSMSVINVQATTAQYRKPGIDPSIQQEFDDIAKSSRQALSEMRSLLSILRNDEDAPTAPVLGIDDIPDLVESARGAGANITCTLRANAPAAVGQAAYRIVQESLSNALRHAPGASVRVTTELSPDGDGVTVQVTNSAPTEDHLPAPGSGLGLAGIEERARALGGTVSARPTASGGFRVRAQLPLPDGE